MLIDRSREGRRPGLVTASSSSSGLSKRRHRNREEGEGQVDACRGGSKRERDRDASSRSSKRLSRRGDRSSATKDSVGGDDDDYDVEDGDGGGASSSVYRMPPPPTATAAKIIGVSVPRKARSVAVKRSHESLAGASTLALGGSAESKLFQPANTWPRKKTKPSGPKTRLPGSSKSLSLVSVIEEDIEIEIAEVLYGLMKQSNKVISKKEENCSSDNVSHAIESGEAGDFGRDCKSSPVPDGNPSSDPSLGVALKSLIAEEAGSTPPVQNSSCDQAVKDEGEERVKVEGPSPNLANSTDANTESGGSKLDEATEQRGSKQETEDSGAVTKERALLTEKKVSTCTELESELKESIMTERSSVILDMENRREKFKIDLMAPPPMASSPEPDGFVDLSPNSKPKAEDVELKMGNRIIDERPVVKSVEESVLVEVEQKKMKTVVTKSEHKLDFDKSNHYIGNSNGNALQKNELKSTICQAEPNTQAQSSPIPLPSAVTSWPNALAPLWCKPPFPTVLPSDKSNGPTMVQPYFLHSQTRWKRCATHHYIASTICFHQQFLNMNHISPAAATSPALLRARPLRNLNAFPSSQNVIFGNPLQAGFPLVNSNVQEMVQLVSIPPGIKEGASEVASSGENPQKKQLVLKQPPQPAPAGNLMHAAPAFVFSLGQHQLPHQTGPSKCASSMNNSLGTGNVPPAGVVGTSALPAVAAVSFNYPGFVGSEAPPYLTILPNSGYPFPISTPMGNPPAFRGGNSVQPVPFLNGSFYPTQILQNPPLPQQQAQSQPLVQPVYQNAIASNGLGSQNQSQSLYLRGAPVGGNNYIMGSVLSHNAPKQHITSQKSEADIRAENAPVTTDAQASHTQRIMHGQSFMVPLQPNSLMPSNTAGVGGGFSGNHGEKKNNQSQEKSSKVGVDLVPSQAFAMSYVSFNGTNEASNVKLSSLPQSPMILRSLPNMAGQGYLFVASPQATHKKNHQSSEGNIGGSFTNSDNGRKEASGKLSSSTAQTLCFNNSAKSLNFMPSSFSGNWTSCPISPTANTPITVESQNLHQPQQQLLQFQKQQHHQHSDGLARSKAPPTNNLASSSVGITFPSVNPFFSQNLVQNNCFPQELPWKNSPKTPTSQAPISSIMQSNRYQISFGGNYRPALASQGHRTPASNPYISVSASPHSVGNSRTSSKSAKANSSICTLQSQQNDNTSIGNTQKSSAACGRNVPSILTTCPGQLPELKY